MQTSQALPRVVHGAVSGAAATGAMSLFMLAWRRALGGGSYGPAVVTERSLRRVGLLPRRETALAATQTAAHFGFGAFAGAVYALTAPPVGRMLPAAGPAPAAARGAAYGVGVWAAAYGTALPALRLTPPPAQDRPRRQPRLVAAHLVYGATLGWLCR